MKRSWFGAALLLILLAIGVLSARAMTALHDPIAENLQAAGEAALAEDWPRAEALSREARRDWKKSELLRACFADHGPMEEIDACFARLEICCRRKEKTAFAAACTETARKVAAIGQAHQLSWENIF